LSAGNDFQQFESASSFYAQRKLERLKIPEALTPAADHTFDFVISDLGLPDGNGIDLMLQLSNDTVSEASP
jgi:DNA-binding NarL/FixJ family response regulator